MISLSDLLIQIHTPIEITTIIAVIFFAGIYHERYSVLRTDLNRLYSRVRKLESERK